MLMIAVFAIGLIAPTAGAGTLTSDRSVQMFVNRIADDGFPSRIETTVGALPSGWTPVVPLPSGAPILGSLQRSNQGSTQIFYEPANVQATFTAYVTELQQAGYVETQTPRERAQGGFEQSPNTVPALSFYCRGAQGIDIVVPHAAVDDLRVDVLAAKAGPLNSCTPRTSAMPLAQTPLPELLPAKGTTVTAEGSGPGTSFAVSFSGTTVSTSFGALISGSVTAPLLLSHYTAQLVHAGWHVTATTHTGNAGFAAFTYAARSNVWNAGLAIYPAENGTFHARIAASGAPLTKHRPPPKVNLPTIQVRIPKTAEAAVLQLARRILNSDSQQTAELYLHKLPPDLPSSIPLPRGSLVGSTVIAPLAPAPFDIGNDSLYYTVTRAQLHEYERVLHDGGWAPTNPGFAQNAGFVSAP